MKPFRSMLFCLTCAACFTPEDKFNEFVDAKKKLAADAGADTGAEVGNSVPLKAAQVTGTYLYAISTPVNPSEPVVYLAEAAGSEMGAQLEVRLRQRPLAFADRMTPVGDFSEWASYLVQADGSYESPPLKTVVPAAANSFGLPLTINVTFSGRFINPSTEQMPDLPVEFFCGTAAGLVEGLNLSLDGSTFAASRVPDASDPSSYPDVVINCNKDLAAPR